MAEWLDYTDYCSSSYGFEDDDYLEPIWHFVCSDCDTHFFEEDGACENFPVWTKKCPCCGVEIKPQRRN